MKNKNLYIGLGVLAVAGIGFYMWRKRDKAEDASEAKTKTADASKSTETPATTPSSTTSSTTSETPATSSTNTSSATGNVASNAGIFTNRFSPSRTIVTPRKNVVAQVATLDTLTKTNIGNIDVVPNRIAVVPVEDIGVGTIGSTLGGGVVPVGRIKSWGGRMENGQKMCFDEAQNKYVVCPPPSH
jgi:hypothetical protein